MTNDDDNYINPNEQNHISNKALEEVGNRGQKNINQNEEDIYDRRDKTKWTTTIPKINLMNRDILIEHESESENDTIEYSIPKLSDIIIK